MPPGGECSADRTGTGTGRGGVGFGAGALAGNDGACRRHRLSGRSAATSDVSSFGDGGPGRRAHGAPLGPAEGRCDGGCSAQPVITAPKDLVAVFSRMRRLRVEPLEPLLTELAAGNPPAPDRLSARILSDPGACRTSAVAMIGDQIATPKGVSGHGLAHNRCFNAASPRSTGSGYAGPRRTHTAPRETTHQQKTSSFRLHEPFMTRQTADCGSIGPIAETGDLRTVPPNELPGLNGWQLAGVAVVCIAGRF
jgi:hypothetical protein